MDLDDPTTVALITADAFQKAGRAHAVYGVSRTAILGSATYTGLNTIDLVRPRSPRYAREAVARAPAVSLRGKQVSVLTPEDFVLFKALSTRDRDIEDAASVLKRSRESLDLDLLRREIDSLAAEIPDFDVRSRLAAIEERAVPAT